MNRVKVHMKNHPTNSVYLRQQELGNYQSVALRNYWFSSLAALIIRSLARCVYH